MAENDEKWLLTPGEIKDTLFALKVRENCLGRRVTPLKKYDALLYAQLAKIIPIITKQAQEDERKRIRAHLGKYLIGQGELISRHDMQGVIKQVLKGE